MTGTDELHAGEDHIIERVRGHLDHARQCRGEHELPFITMTYAQSLDGCIARSEGETLRLSNSRSLRLTHQLRAIHDTILVGINTVVRDDPRLNVRMVQGRNPQPVVVDSRLRFPLDARLLRDPCVRPIIFAGSEASTAQEHRLAAAGASVIRLAEREDGLLDLPQIFHRLRTLGHRSVMVEGGASIITSILSSLLADQVLLTISPRFVGGLRAVKVQADVPADQMPRLCNLQHQWLGEDLIIRGDLDRAGRPPYTPTATAAALQTESQELTISRHNGDTEQR